MQTCIDSVFTFCLALLAYVINSLSKFIEFMMIFL